MSMVGFPLLLIPLAIYNIIVFLMPGTPLAAPLFAVALMSGAVWQVTLSDILLGVAILMLMFEVMKGARPGGKYLTDHLLALLVLGGATAEFLLLPQFGNSTFAMLTALALVDFLSGLALRSSRKPRLVPQTAAAHDDVAPVGRRTIAVSADADPEPRAEGRIEPRVEKPATPHVPTAAPVAESILLEKPAPVPVIPEAGPSDTKQTHQPGTPALTSEVVSPQMRSPGLAPAAHNDHEPPR